MKAVSAHNLTKRYGTVEALGGIDMEVERGELFGIIGPDGAGKTTLFRTLTTLILPDAGSAQVDGLDIVDDYRSIRRRIGYMPGRFSLYQDLSVEENLEFFAAVFGGSVAQNRPLIEEIYSRLEPFRTRKAGKLSGGMKQKLALCCALIHSPSVLFLDEPTTGVDPSSRKEFWEMLHNLRKQGITIIVSTPYMDEAKQCNHIALMQNGRFLERATPDDLVAQFGEKLWSISSSKRYALLTAARQFADTKSCFPFGAAHHITFRTATPDLDAFAAFVRNAGINDLSITPVQPDIEDCFMKLSKTSDDNGR